VPGPPVQRGAVVVGVDFGLGAAVVRLVVVGAWGAAGALGVVLVIAALVVRVPVVVVVVASPGTVSAPERPAAISVRLAAAWPVPFEPHPARVAPAASSTRTRRVAGARGTFPTPSAGRAAT